MGPAWHDMFHLAVCDSIIHLFLSSATPAGPPAAMTTACSLVLQIVVVIKPRFRHC